MATLTERFPMCVAFGFEGGAGYKTSIAVNLGGKEKRNQDWSQSRGRWRATQLGKKEDVTEMLVKYFHAAAGRQNNFPFRDWIDYKVASSEGIVTLVSGTTYQLYKRYTIGGISRDRKIIRPVSAVIAGGGTYSSVNTSTGTFTHDSGAAPTGWAGQFDCLCRFDQDELNIEIVNRNGGGGELIFTWGNIGIVEDKES